MAPKGLPIFNVDGSEITFYVNIILLLIFFLAVVVF